MLKSVLNTIADATISIDESGTIETFSPAAERIFGYKADEVIGQNVNILMPEPYHSEHDTYVRSYLETGAAKIIGTGREVTAVRKDGSIFPIELAVGEFQIAGRRKFTGIIRDITSRKQIEADLRQRLLLAEFNEEVSAALIVPGTLRDILQRCAQAIVRYMDAAFARIWTLNTRENVLHLQASAGMYTHLDGAHGKVPVGKFKIGMIAQERKPHLTNRVIGDPSVGDQEWARREGMVSFAGHPLIVDDRVVGVMALFARHPLSENTLTSLRWASKGIALGIDRKKAEWQLQESEELYRDLFENASDLIQSVDNDGRFLYVNRAWKKILGYEDCEIPALTIVDVIDPESLPHCMDIFQRIMKGEEVREVEAVFRSKDGRKIVVEGNLNCRYKEGQPVSTRGIFRDITERREAEQKQTKLLKEIAQANRELKDFAYVVSHDLKAPLRAISSLAGWIATDYGDQLGEEGKEQITLLLGRVKRMHNLIDGVLQYSRVGRIREEKLEVSIQELIDLILQSLAPPEDITIRIETPLPTLLTEKTRMEQVFQNLIGNAIKYMNRQEGEIRIGCVPEEDRYLFYVADNGPGIDPKHFERIFQLFQTLAARDEVESTGVGLSVVKKIVEMYGGNIWVESEPDQGASFFFTVPRSDSSQSSSGEVS